MVIKAQGQGQAGKSREVFWRRIVAQQQRSGLTQTGYCRRHRIALGNFGWWKRELQRRDESRAGRQGFVPVRVVQQRLPSAGGEFEVELGNARRIRIRAPFDAEALRELIAILEAPAC